MFVHGERIERKFFSVCCSYNTICDRMYWHQEFQLKREERKKYRNSNCSSTSHETSQSKSESSYSPLASLRRPSRSFVGDKKTVHTEKENFRERRKREREEKGRERAKREEGKESNHSPSSLYPSLITFPKPGAISWQGHC